MVDAENPAGYEAQKTRRAAVCAKFGKRSVENICYFLAKCDVVRDRLKA
jgi:hypothetical protein